MSPSAMSYLAEHGYAETDIEYLLASNLHADMVDILGYGMYTGVYFVALYLTLYRGTERIRIASAILITAMWILITVHTSIVWAYIDYGFIQHGESRETQLHSLVFFRGSDQFQLDLMNGTVTFMNLFLTDMTMIWRCWVLCNRRWRRIIIPILCLGVTSTCFVLRCIWIYKQAVRTDKNTNMELIYTSTTVITNIFCTTSIIYQLLSIGGWRKSLRTYRGLIEILVESSILYTVVYMVRVALEIHAQYFSEVLDARHWYPQALGYSITGLAPTLIIARVAAGHARPDYSWTSAAQTLSECLQFASATVVDSDADCESRACRSEDIESLASFEMNRGWSRL